MKRGLIQWNKNEVPEREFESRIEKIKKLMKSRGLDAVAIYGDACQSNNLSYLTNFFTDWLTWPDWGPYPDDLPVYDAWPTWGSAGFDLEAVGVLKPQKCKADANIDGRVDGADMKILAAAWLRSFGQDGWSQRCDLSEPRLKIDLYDFAVLADEWGKVEDWRLE